MLSADWRSNRHILKRNGTTLCGLKTRKSKDIVENGKFKGYMSGSITEVWGFYGSGKCKTCLKLYLQRRLSPEGKKLVQKYKARMLLHVWQTS